MSVAFIDRILPAPVGGGFVMEDYWIWCGSVIKGEEGQYHMFASRWPRSLPLWRAEGKFEIVAKDLTGGLCGEKHAGIHAYSTDGVDWDLSGDVKAYSRRVVWDDGNVTVQGCLERPQLLIEDGHPTHLFAATGDGPGGFNASTKTWNMVLPLKKAS